MTNFAIYFLIGIAIYLFVGLPLFVLIKYLRNKKKFNKDKVSKGENNE